MIIIWVAVAIFLIAWAWLVGWLAGQAKGRVDTLWEIDEAKRLAQAPKPSREIDPW